MSTMLHIINKSPTERNSLDSCLLLANSGDVVLLIEDGVYAAIAKAEHAEKIVSRKDDFRFYILGPDVAARGLSDIPLIEDITVVDYEGFVAMVTDHAVSPSWL